MAVWVAGKNRQDCGNLGQALYCEHIWQAHDDSRLSPNARSSYIFFVPTRARKSRVANAEPATMADFTRANANASSRVAAIKESPREELLNHSGQSLLRREL